MPTTKQLFNIWKFQLANFGGAGEPQKNHQGSEEHGFTGVLPVDRPLVSKGAHFKLTGKVIGQLKSDPNNDDVVIFEPND